MSDIEFWECFLDYIPLYCVAEKGNNHWTVLEKITKNGNIRIPLIDKKGVMFV